MAIGSSTGCDAGTASPPAVVSSVSAYAILGYPFTNGVAAVSTAGARTAESCAAAGTDSAMATASEAVET